MGGGMWSSNSYTSRLSSKRAAGYSTPFAHTEDIRAGRKAAGVHESTDPKWRAGDKSPNAGRIIREAFDNDDHPESLPIAVLFDVTGSMGGLPRVLQAKLPQLHGLLMRKGYVEHPQMLFGAIGDAFSDSAPIQIGQFEADNRGDEQLENLFLEGGGGGGNHESYELSAYYMARHTELDSLKKRGKKGYLFFIGDERIYDTVQADHIERLIGTNDPEEKPQSIPTKDIFEELKEKFEVFFLFARQGSYADEQVLPESAAGAGALGWRELLGQHAITLDDADAVCETIALTLGVMEGAVSLEDGMDDLKEIGAESSAVEAAGKALATVGAGTSAIAEGTGDLPGMEEDGEGGTERL